MVIYWKRNLTLSMLGSYNRFVIGLLFQIEPGKEMETIKKFQEILEKEEAIREYKLYTILGKHDILCILYSDNLAEAVDVAYAMVYSVEAVRDFSKITGFEWYKLSNVNKNHKTPPPISFTLIKVDTVNTSLQPIKSILEVIKGIKKEINKIKDTIIDIEINGCFGWHDLMCTIYCESYKKVSDLIEKFRRNKSTKIWSTSSIPIINENLTDTAKFALLTYCKPGEEKEVCKWLKENDFEVYAKFGIYDFIAYSSCEAKDFYTKLMRFRRECHGIRDTASFVMNPPLMEKMDIAEASLGKNPAVQSAYNDYISYLKKERRERKPVNLKLLSLEAIARMIKRIPMYAYLLPLNIENMIRWIRESSLAPFEKNEFLRYIRYLFQQRFSGSQVEGLLGIEGGLLQQMGGYQKMVLAAESIPFMASLSMGDFGRALIKNSFVIFEHSGRFETPLYGRQKGPIIIHLPLVKYTPWYWVLTLHELGEHFHVLIEKKELVKKKDFLNVYEERGKSAIHKIIEKVAERELSTKLSEDIKSYIAEWNKRRTKLGKKGNFHEYIGRESFPDNFACKFVDKKVYYQILREFYEDEFPAICRSMLVDGSNITSEHLVKNYINRIKEGEIIFEFPDAKHFFSYVEAYLSMSKEAREETKCLASFVLSLYNQRIKIYKRIKKGEG